MLMAYNLYKEDIDTILPQAAGLETYHNHTLLHDDLMDKADMRRNKQTVHKVWGENAAILSGDAMLILAYRLMADCASDKLKKVLDLFTETTMEICEGQQWDMEFETRDDVTADEYINKLEDENNRLANSFKYIKHPDMVEGYYIHKSIADEIDKIDRNDIEPRIDEYDEFYIVSYLAGQDIKHTSVSLTSNSGNSVSTAFVAYDGAQNYRFKSGGKAYESITFKHEQCDTLGHFAATNDGQSIKGTFRGKKAYSINLSKKQVKAIAETYRYATCKTTGKASIQKRLYLEQKLDLARKHIEQTKIAE